MAIRDYEKEMQDQLKKMKEEAYKQLAQYPNPSDNYSKINELEKKLKEAEDEIKRLKTLPSTVIGTDSPIAISVIPIFYCPECRDQMETTYLPDMLRFKIVHHERNGCSRSMTIIIRPIAQFTQMI